MANTNRAIRQTGRFVAALAAILSLEAFTPGSLRAGAEPVRTNLVEWTRLPDFAAPLGVAAAFAGSVDGVVLAGGGANFPDAPPWQGGVKRYHDGVWRFEPGAEDWKPSGRLPRPRAYGASVSLEAGAGNPAGVLCIGGSDADSHTADCVLLHLTNGQVSLRPLPPLPSPCAQMAAVKLGHAVYVAGGLETPSSIRALTTFWRLDLDALDQGWTALESWPGPGRILPVMGVQGGAVYLFSGAELSPGPDGKASRRYLRDAYAFTPGKGWRRLADLPRAAVAAPTPAPAVGPSHLLVLGGDDGTLAGFEPKDQHPGFRRDLLAYDRITDTWTVVGETDVAAVTAPVVPFKSGFVVVSGEIRPGVRTPAVTAGRVLTHKAAFGWINYTTLILYLLAMVGIGAWCSRKNKTTNDYFRGGQSIPWWAAGISIFATMLSSITFMAIPATAYGTDWKLFLANSYILITPLVVFVYLPFYRRLNVTSAYEYLEKRFNVATRLIASSLFMVFQAGRIAIVLYLPALALSTVSRLDLDTSILLMGVLCIVYTCMGGLEAVVWTDVLQTVVLIGGALISLALIAWPLEGGIGDLFRIGAGKSKFFEEVPWNWDLLSGTAWTILLGSLFHNLFAYTASQDIVQRYVTTADEKTARRAIWMNAAISVPAQAIFFLIGTALFAYYTRHPARLDPTLPTDAIFPLFIVRELPVGLAGLIVAGIFAAAQSTLSGSLNSVAAAYITDVHKRFRPATTDAACLRLARWVTVLVGAVGMGIALWLGHGNLRSAFEAFLNVIGLFGGVISGLFALGIFFPRANGRGAMIGGVAGAVAVWLVQKHVHFYVYAFTGIVTTLAVGLAASLLLGGPRRNLRNLTIFTLETEPDGRPAGPPPSTQQE